MPTFAPPERDRIKLRDPATMSIDLEWHEDDTHRRSVPLRLGPTTDDPHYERRFFAVRDRYTRGNADCRSDDQTQMKSWNGRESIMPVLRASAPPKGRFYHPAPPILPNSSNDVMSSMVRTAGLEPASPYGEQIFLPLRLSPPPRKGVRGLDYPFALAR